MGTRAWMAGAVGLAMVAGWPVGAGDWRAGPALAAAQEARGADQEAETEEDETLQEMMSLSIDRSSAEHYADLMGLDELQRDVAMELYRAYSDRYRDAAVATRDAMRRFEESMEAGDVDFEDMEAVMRKTMTIVLGFLDRAIGLGEQYVGDLGDLAIDDAQRAGHERVVRARQRGLAVAISAMDGGGEGLVDLTVIGRGLDPPLLAADGQGPAEQALYEYERELGAACGPMVDRALRGIREMLGAMSTGEDDGRLQGALEDDMEAMIDRFGGINDRYAQRVLAALPEDRRAEWDRAYKRARWPEVYAPGEAHRTRDAALELDGLAEDQRESIAGIMDHYAREAEGASQRWIQAVRALDQARRDLGQDSTPDDWEAYQARNQAVQEARTARMAIDERFAGRILQVLTPEQRDAMPAGEVDVDAVLRELGGG